MNQQFNIEIDKPCAKDYNQFSKTNAGGFCGNCKKEVIDFTKMSDEEVLNYFKNKQSHVCGQFNTSQLKTYSDTIYTSEKRHFNWINAGLITFSLLTFLPISNSHSQNIQIKPTSITASVDEKTQNEDTETVKGNYTAAGIVSDEHDPLIGVNIVLKGSTIGTVTDLDGKFIFPEALKTGDVLIFSYVGYDTKEFVVTNNSPNMINIKMGMTDMIMMGEVSVHQLYSSKRSLKQKFKGFFK